MAERIKTVRDLNVYKVAFDCAMEIFEISKKFPADERFSLTDQTFFKVGLHKPCRIMAEKKV